jgi:tetratricopeptide (TPR) repeat protein
MSNIVKRRLALKWALVDKMVDIARSSPRDPDAYFALGAALERVERFQRASVCYQKALAFAPGDADIIARLAAVEEKLRKLAKYNLNQQRRRRQKRAACRRFSAADAEAFARERSSGSG